MDEPLVQYEGAGTTDRRWLHADERGSVVAISDASGSMLTINRYDEYGKSQATNAGRFQYTGQMWLPELGAYYYKARVYAPGLGRFLQTDPIDVAGGINLYAYVGNDPANFVDPLGLCGSGPTYVPYVTIDDLNHNGKWDKGEPVLARGVIMTSAGDGPCPNVNSGGSRAGGGGAVSTDPKEVEPSKTRSQCAAAVSGVAAYALSTARHAPTYVRTGVSIWRAILLGGEVGGAAGGGVLSLEGAIIGAVVGGVVYYLDQKSNNAAANALRNEGSPYGIGC
jgi:RHS repeat-associated protein